MILLLGAKHQHSHLQKQTELYYHNKGCSIIAAIVPHHANSSNTNNNDNKNSRTNKTSNSSVLRTTLLTEIAKAVCLEAARIVRRAELSEAGWGKCSIIVHVLFSNNTKSNTHGGCLAVEVQRVLKEAADLRCVRLKLKLCGDTAATGADDYYLRYNRAGKRGADDDQRYQNLTLGLLHERLLLPTTTTTTTNINGNENENASACLIYDFFPCYMDSISIGNNEWMSISEDSNCLLRLLLEIIVLCWNVLCYPVFLYKNYHFVRNDLRSMILNSCALVPHDQVFVYNNWDNCSKMMEEIIGDLRRSMENVNVNILRIDGYATGGYIQLLRWQSGWEKYAKMIDEVLDRVACADNHGDPCDDDMWSDSDNDNNSDGEEGVECHTDALIP